MHDVEERRREPRWTALISGDDWDLSALAPHFDATMRLEKGPEGWGLMADRFESLDSHLDVYHVAVELVDALRGIAVVKLRTSRPVSMGRILERQPDGSVTPHVFAQAHVATASARVHAAGIVTYADGTTPEPAPPPSWEPMVKLASTDDRVRLTFAFLVLEPTWHRLYAAYEGPLKDGRTGRRAGIERRGASSRELELFTHTANNARALGVESRHGHLDTVPPLAPMTLTYAKDLVWRVVDAWVDELGRLMAPQS